MSIARRLLVVALVATAVVAPSPAKGYFGGPPDVYKVGAAVRDITPAAGVPINVGGNGLGDGSSPVPGLDESHTRVPGAERIAVRALYVERVYKVVIADIETQGMFAAYKGRVAGYGLADMAAEVSRRIPGLPASHVIIAADHSHSGPDTIGAWGFVPESYMKLVFDSTVGAIVDAYSRRVDSTLWFGQALAEDLVYNQNCTEALNQSPSPAYPGPAVCNVPDQGDKDAYVRVLQAQSVATGAVVSTLVSYNAHATLGGAGGVHGDWPQFLSDRLSSVFGGVGIGMQGAVGRVQPCRPQCSFTNPAQFGGATDRKTAYVNALIGRVNAALDVRRSMRGIVTGHSTFIREPITSPAVLALFTAGGAVGAELRRSDKAPYLVGNVIGTPVTSLVIGDLLVSGFPGEAYPNISMGVAAAARKVGLHMPLGLANDQIGYLISPAEAYPMVAAEVAVNDNSIFNVSPTVGDHVMCASIANADSFYELTVPPRCAAFGVVDAAG